MTLVKAKLKAIDGGTDIEFMYNPNLLTFNRSISLEQSPGARTEQGMNKTSFKHPNPYTLTISNILIDTDESGGNALDYIKKFQGTVEFQVTVNGMRRPPLYLFTWGGNSYLRCFVKTLNYKLTKFRPDGTPVRAFVDLTLEEIDLTNTQGSMDTNVSSNPDMRETDGRTK